jgi:TPR repeat protein
MKNRLFVMILWISFAAAFSTPAMAGFDAGLAAYNRGDYSKAFIEFRADNSAQAKYYLSLMYERGDGIAKDPAKSLEWLRRAAKQGLDVAQANLGIMYCEGYHVDKDPAEGLKWLRLAAAQGLEEAQSVLLTASAP